MYKPWDTNDKGLSRTIPCWTIQKHKQLTC